eukprot:189264-Chlamydomonas_euryale.AAC.2
MGRLPYFSRGGAKARRHPCRHACPPLLARSLPRSPSTSFTAPEADQILSRAPCPAQEADQVLPRAPCPATAQNVRSHTSSP